MILLYQFAGLFLIARATLETDSLARGPGLI